MGTTAAPAPISLDQAITNAKTSEGAYLSSQNAKGGTASALSQALAADSSAAEAVASTGAQYFSDLEVLKASINAVESGLPAAPAPDPSAIPEVAQTAGASQ